MSKNYQDPIYPLTPLQSSLFIFNHYENSKKQHYVTDDIVMSQKSKHIYQTSEHQNNMGIELLQIDSKNKNI